MKRTLTAALAALALVATATPALAANPSRPAFREALADYHDKEFMLHYAFGPGAMDFALFRFLTLGVSADQVFAPQHWLYRGTLKLVDNPDGGLAVAFTGGATHIREILVGNNAKDPVWGWQAGMVVSLATESGMTLRGGFQLYDTDMNAPDGQGFLFTPEIAYRWSLFEFAFGPGWPLTAFEPTWVAVRLRL